MTAPNISNEQIEAIYKSTFEGMPGCVRSAPKPNETVFAFARALLATVLEVGPIIAGQCRNDGRCQYAIDHGAEGLGACPVGKCCMPIAPTIPEGYVLVPIEPDHAILKAMAESRAVDDEGEFPLMLDLLDFGGENKVRTVLRAAYAAAIAAAPAIPLPASPVQDDARDAARYHWLRNNSAGQWEHPLVVEQMRAMDRIQYIGPLTGKALDAAIDAALAGPSTVEF